MKTLLYTISIALLFSSCEKEINWETRYKSPYSIIVEGLLTNEQKIQSIKLTKPLHELNQEPEPVSGAEVFISYDNQSISLNENPENPGIYETNSIFYGVINKTYHLTIYHNTDTFEASTYMVPVSSFAPLTYQNVEGSSNQYKINWVADNFNSRESAMWEILLNWSHLPNYGNDTSMAKIYHYTLSTLDVSQIFKTDKYPVYFPAGTRIIQKKYSLNNEHSEFIRSMLLETEWRGGYYNSINANSTSNLSEGATGYFGASSVIADTIYVMP